MLGKGQTWPALLPLVTCQTRKRHSIGPGGPRVSAGWMSDASAVFLASDSPPRRNKRRIERRAGVVAPVAARCRVTRGSPDNDAGPAPGHKSAREDSRLPGQVCGRNVAPMARHSGRRQITQITRGPPRAPWFGCRYTNQGVHPQKTNSYESARQTARPGTDAGKKDSLS